jgi:hypothetical protein
MSPIKSAVAVAIASAVATSAFALDASSMLASTTVALRIGGSTAVDNTLLATETALETVSPGGLCAAGSIDVYQIGNPSNRLTYCTGSTTLAAGLSGVPIAIFKESNVGSFNGPGPLVGVATTVAASGYQLLFLNAGTPGVSGSSVLTSTNCPTVSSTSLGASFNSYTLHQCQATAASIQVAANPTAGIADVEANVLHDPNDTAFPAGLLGNLNGSPGLDVVWGVAVTKKLYYALQAAEHLSDGTVISTCNTANNDSPQCAPALSKTQVASILVNQGTTIAWNQFANLSNATDNNIYICRRDPGSGTEASWEAYFLGARCGGATNPSGSKLIPWAEDGAFIFEQGSTGGIRNCLQAFDQGGTITPFNPAHPPVHFAGGEWAIGVMTSEVTSGNLTVAGSNLCNDCFRMIALNGVLPTLDNVINGYDDFFSTDVFYTTSTGPDAAGSGASASLFTSMQGRMGHPVFTAGTNTTFAGRPWGNGGDLAPAGVYAAGNPPTIPATAATATSNPVNAFSKAFTGAVDNCNTPVLQLASGTLAPPAVLLGTGNINH